MAFFVVNSAIVPCNGGRLCGEERKSALDLVSCDVTGHRGLFRGPALSPTAPRIRPIDRFMQIRQPYKSWTRWVFFTPLLPFFPALVPWKYQRDISLSRTLPGQPIMPSIIMPHRIKCRFLLKTSPRELRLGAGDDAGGDQHWGSASGDSIDSSNGKLYSQVTTLKTS